jgi:hypothetical protein
MNGPGLTWIFLIKLYMSFELHSKLSIFFCNLTPFG